MMQDDIRPAPGSRKKSKRVGRGNASGQGTYAGRGRRGQKARSSVDLPRAFEGGQLPMVKRLPQKRGFVNHFRIEYRVVNLKSLDVFEAGSVVTLEKLLEAGLVKNLKQPVKLLSVGEITHALSVKVNKCSAAAKAKVEAAGGSVEEVGNASEAE